MYILYVGPVYITTLIKLRDLEYQLFELVFPTH